MNKKIAMSALVMVSFLSTNSFAQGQEGYINYELVNVRSDSNMNSSVLFVAKKGEKVSIIEKKSGFILVKIKDQKGWIPDKAIKIDDNTNNKDVNKYIKKSASNVKYVVSDNLNFRNAASTNSKVLQKMKKGDSVIVISESAGWSKVNYNGEEGYVSSRFLSNSYGEIKNIIVDKPKTMFVTSQTLNIRSDLKATSKKIKELRCDDTVEVLEVKNGWAKVKVDNTVGYASAYYLREEPSFTKQSVNENTKNNENVQSESVNSNENVQVENISDNNITNNNRSVNNKDKINYIDMGMSLDQHINDQLNDALNVDSQGEYHKASKEELSVYMNPDNYNNNTGKYQFLRIDKYSNDISVDQLNNYLNSHCKPGSVFYNQGATFINAAKKNNINVLYLVAHSMLETGYGSSALASGINCNNVKVYNFFGIGAFDGSATKSGAEAAFKNGWTSVFSGIDGAARWISQKYIHNPRFRQNTLYGMKWSPDFKWHQYATDIKWPSAIAERISDISKYSNDLSNLSFDIPKYR